MLSLIHRNIKVFVRDRMSFIFSLLAVVILLLLYKMFLGQIQINGIKSAMHVSSVSSNVLNMVNYWLVAGLVVMTSMTSTLGAYGVLVDDRQHDRVKDFELTLVRPVCVSLSYIIAAIIVGSLITLLMYILSIIAFIGFDGLLIGISNSLLIFLLIVLSCFVSLIMLYPVVTFIKTNIQFASFSTIVGTGVGFFVGVYISMNNVTKGIRNVMTWFPLTGISSLIKKIIMHDSLIKVFKHAPSYVKLSYERNYGINLTYPSGAILSNHNIWVYLLIVILSFALLDLIISKLVRYGESNQI